MDAVRAAKGKGKGYSKGNDSKGWGKGDSKGWGKGDSKGGWGKGNQGGWMEYKGGRRL